MLPMPVSPIVMLSGGLPPVIQTVPVEPLWPSSPTRRFPFTVLPDHTTAPVQIAYNNVQQMGPNMSKASWIAIGALAAVAVVIIVWAALYYSNNN